MRTVSMVLIAALSIVLVLSIFAAPPAHMAGRIASRAASATRTKTKTKTRTATVSSTKTRTRTKTATRSQTPKRSATATAVSATYTPTAPSVPTLTATNLPTTTRTPAPTDTVIPSMTPSATAAPFATATPVVVPTVTVASDRSLNTVVNGGFEDTWMTGWSTHGSGFQLSSGPPSGAAHGGTWVLNIVRFGGFNADAYQTVNVPTLAPYLRYAYQMRYASGTCDGTHLFSVTAGSEAQTIDACGLNNNYTWQVGTIDMSAYAGQQVEISFALTAESNTFIYLDDVGFVSGPERAVDYY